MYLRRILRVVFLISGLMLHQTVRADITGKVSDETGKTIVGATLTLVKKGITATSGVDGKYTLATTNVKIQQKIQGSNSISLYNGFLNFTIAKASPVKYEIFDIKGNLLKKEELRNLSEGHYSFNIVKDINSTTLFIIRASIGNDKNTFYCLPVSRSKNGIYLPDQLSSTMNNEFAKIAAVIDTLKVTANGYKPQSIPVSSYDTEINVTMESAGTSGDCGEFKIISSKLSTAIQTVGIVEWSYGDNTKIDSAYIEFWQEGNNNIMKAPVDLKEQNYRTLLLGMKQQKKYVYRIVVKTGKGTCMSKDTTITSGTLSGAPKITKSGTGTPAIKKGFIVTSSGLGLSGGGFGGGGGGTPMAIIFDLDGDVVWAASAPQMPSRARMSWDGKDMWVINANVMGGATGGETRRISMDGSKVERNVKGLSGTHHDFTVTPNNELIFIAHTNSRSSQILSYNPTDGTIKTLVADVTTLYQPSGDVHPNYIQYCPWDDSFIFSDRNPNLFIKFLRNGTHVWQFGGTNPKGKSFSLSGESWQVNHGFEYEKDGRFVFFNNGGGMGGFGGGSSKVMEFQLTESSMNAKKLWEKGVTSSSTLGNLQRLPEGQLLISSSNAGKIEIINNSQTTLVTFSAPTGTDFGYAEYRESLYEPPADY